MPQISSWLPVAPDSDFTIYNLPYGAFSSDGGERHLGVAIGSKIVDLHRLAETGLLDGACDRAILQAPVLNPLLAAGRPVWKALRLRLAALLRDDADGDPALKSRNVAGLVIDQRGTTMHVPMTVGDYVDFYSSIEHATNLGKLFRPQGEPLMPNWRWIPIGYHGRSSTIFIDGTPIRRPAGQKKAADAAAPAYGPSRRLDIELEMGFITGPGNPDGAAISPDQARDHIFGMVIVNDWSARDIQAWEYQPLGPFLGKSFATTISPWVVTLDALEPFRVSGPVQEPPPLPHLASNDRMNYDVNLAVDLQSAKMRAANMRARTISQTNARGLYWSAAQQLAHVTSNGTIVRPGDLYSSGTISGAQDGQQGSLIELTWNGARPISLPSDERRAFLEDGDEVTLRAWCVSGDFRIGFGRCSGRIAGT